METDELADTLIDMGAALAASGCPSYRLEDVVKLVASTEGFDAHTFALPSGLFLRLSNADGTEHTSRMSRVGDWGVDLGRLVLIDEIFNDIVSHRVSMKEARTRIREVVRHAPEHSRTIVFAASVVVSGSAAVFFQGGPIDVLVASIVGAVIAGSRRAGDDRAGATSRRNARRLLTDFLGGLFAAFAAGLALRVWPQARPEIIVPAGAIALFPGMTFTTGVAEVAQKNVVSGAARLIESSVTLLLILFGVALVGGLKGLIGTELLAWLAQNNAANTALPWPFQIVALIASSFAFGALFQMPRRWMWSALVSCSAGWLVVALTVHYRLPGHVGAFCAALAVCTLANGMARKTQRPAQLFQLPGMMLLVPGSFGFLSLGDFLERKVIDGAQRGFTMALTGAALVIGVLVANVLVPSRKLL